MRDEGLLGGRLLLKTWCGVVHGASLCCLCCARRQHNSARSTWVTKSLLPFSAFTTFPAFRRAAMAISSDGEGVLIFNTIAFLTRVYRLCIRSAVGLQASASTSVYFSTSID